MRPRRGRPTWRVALLLGLVVLSGCEPAPGDDGAPMPAATVTITRTPEPVVAVPSTVPVAPARFDAATPTWSTGDRLVVGNTSVSLAPRTATSFVLADGGVYFLDGDEVWFTDLRRIRATGLVEVNRLAMDGSGRHLLVEVERPDGPASYAFDTRTGRQVDASGLAPRPAAQPRGWAGPGRYTLTQDPGRSVRVVDRRTDRVRVLQPQIRSLRLAGWSGPRELYGLEERSGRSARMLGCDAATARCRELATLPPGTPLILEGGAPAVTVVPAG